MDRPTKRTYHALDYLPATRLTEYAKGNAIYSGKCESLFLVAFGRMKVSRLVADGYETAVRIVPPEGIYVSIKSATPIPRAAHVSVRAHRLSLFRDLVSDRDTGIHLLRLGLLGCNVVRHSRSWFG